MGFRDHNHRLEPHRSPDQRQSNTGVTRRTFNNGAAGFQITTGDGVLDNIERSAILDGLAGVQKLRLAKNFAAGFFADFVQSDQRGMTDSIGQIACNAHEIPFRSFPFDVAGGTHDHKGRQQRQASLCDVFDLLRAKTVPSRRAPPQNHHLKTAPSGTLSINGMNSKNALTYLRSCDVFTTPHQSGRCFTSSAYWQTRSPAPPMFRQQPK